VHDRQDDLVDPEAREPVEQVGKERPVDQRDPAQQPAPEVVAADGVTVNSIQPGLHDTDRIRALVGDNPSGLAASVPSPSWPPSARKTVPGGPKVDTGSARRGIRDSPID